MANRYDDERGWGRRGSSQQSYRGSQPGYGFQDDDDDDDRSFGERNFGGERYFGSGRQGFGEGYSESESYGGYGETGSNPSSFGRSGRFGESGGSRRRGGSSYGGGYGRGSTGRSYGSSSSRPYSGSQYGSGRYGSTGPYGGSQARYGRGSYGSSSYGSSYYGSSYPESERGYMSDRENYGDERGWWDRTSDEVASWFGDEDAERRREMDERSSHRGRGPRGYTRSDDRIKEDINDELTESWNLDASDIEVEVNEGNVVLTGTVNSRYDKRLAEDLAENVSGVKNVENRIRVNTGQTYGQSTTPTSQTRSAGGGGTT